MATIPIIVENRSSTNNPQVTLNLPTDGKLYNFEDLKPKSTAPGGQILATHLTSNAPKFDVAFSGGSTGGGISSGVLKSGKPMDIRATGATAAVDIKKWSVQTNKIP